MSTASSQSSMPLPLEIDEVKFQSGGHLILVDGSSARTKTSMMSFFVASAKLFELEQQGLATFTSFDGTVTDPLSGIKHCFVGSFTVFDIDNKMVDWHDKLPTNIKLKDPSNADVDSSGRISAYHRQAVVLHIR